MLISFSTGGTCFDGDGNIDLTPCGAKPETHVLLQPFVSDMAISITTVSRLAVISGRSMLGLVPKPSLAGTGSWLQ